MKGMKAKENVGKRGKGRKGQEREGKERKTRVDEIVKCSATK